MRSSSYDDAATQPLLKARQSTAARHHLAVQLPAAGWF